MAINVANDWTRPVPIGWPLPGEPHFARSRAYGIFLRELRRYTIEEISGRSFLIAGHRGAGKTALVNQAVRELRTKLLQESINSETSSIARRVRLQRPLIVKLVGQSLIAPPPPKRVPAPEQPAAEKAKAAVAGGETVGGASAPTTAPAATPPGTPTEVSLPDQVANALVHITIALYRALAAEVALGFGVHAREADQGRPGDNQELAAQFSLDLDNAPEPAVLRHYWSQLGRLAHGVLWPSLADATLDANEISDQALREIVAVATAAQAFQVCSGAVTWKMTSGETAARQNEVQAKVDLKDLVSRLGAILTGTAAGGAAAIAHAGAVPAIGIGLAVWLASGMTLSWSGSRSRNSQKSVDYTFLRDRSVQTLDRDLPLVIERVRAAGLAPVFIIDELDKLGEDAAATIAAILNRLKHLMADYGFFCFLTDRGYYDEVGRLVATQAYPTEHTYFSDRLLVINGSKDLFDYITGMLRSDVPGEVDNLPIATFALATIYASKLNFTDLIREITRATGDTGTLVVSADDLRTRNDLRLAAAIQLSCDEALREGRYATRFANEAAFAQLAIDALYYIPRRWEEAGDNALDLSDGAIKAYLIERSEGRSAAAQPDATPPPTPPADPVAETPAPAAKGRGARARKAAEPEPGPAKPLRINPTDLRMATELVRRQTELLIDFTALAEAVRSRPGIDPWRLPEIVPTELGAKGLICAAKEKFQYRFLLDETGLPLDQVRQDAWLSAEQQDEVAAMLALITAFDTLMALVGLSADGLVAVGLLPATISATLLADARLALENAGRTQLETDALKRGLTSARQLARALSDSGRVLMAWLFVLQEVRMRTGGAAGTPAETLGSLGRYLSFGVSGGSAGADRSTILTLANSVMGVVAPLDLGTAAGLDDLVGMLGARAMAGGRAQELSPTEIDALWTKWRTRVLAWFEQGINVVTDIGIEDLVSAASRAMPGSLFRADLATMGVRDWSAVALAGLPRNGVTAAPLWALIAALRALGFDGRMMQGLARQLASVFKLDVPGADEEVIDRILKGAGERPAGLVVLVPDGLPTISITDIGEGRPMIVVAPELYPAYEEALNVLATQRAFVGVIDAE
jgi:hypothetical protein